MCLLKPRWIQVNEQRQINACLNTQTNEHLPRALSLSVGADESEMSGSSAESTELTMSEFTAGRQPTVTLTVDVDRQAEGEVDMTTRDETELVCKVQQN